MFLSCSLTCVLQYQKAVLSQGGPRNAALNFGTYNRGPLPRKYLEFCACKWCILVRFRRWCLCIYL